VRAATPFVLAFACVLLACSRSGETLPPKTVEMTGDDDMKFNVASFEAKPLQKVTLTLKNIGELPKEAMSHNWVLLEQGTDALKLVQAGAEHAESDYIPADRSVYVLAKTKLVGPGESDTITFIAPRTAGSYEYVCTFPDHYARGMKGTMTVPP
jgi:azurin